MIVKIDPNKEHLREIKWWLEKEWKNKGEGFYCSWKIIEESYINNQILVGISNNITVGFILFNEFGNKAILDIIEIRPNHRRLGFGFLLLMSTIKFFQSKGIKKVEADCINHISENLCKKLGFSKDNDPVVYSVNNYCYRM